MDALGHFHSKPKASTAGPAAQVCMCEIVQCGCVVFAVVDVARPAHPLPFFGSMHCWL